MLISISRNRVSTAFMICLTTLCLTSTVVSADKLPTVELTSSTNRIDIKIGKLPFATYVFRDQQTLRPFLANVHAPNGVRVTRHHPPRTKIDSSDHATMHPGIFLAFGDLAGVDFWRNRAEVIHDGFVEKHHSEKGRASFTVRNKYRAGKKLACTEVCRHSILVRPHGFLLLYDSRFHSKTEFYFGDQEEMGLGVRVDRQLRVRGGNGRLTNSSGQINEKQAWGKQADWCDYSGIVENRRIGILLIPHPANFRRSWFHARDYGFVAANPFGRNAFTRGEKSKLVVKADSKFRLRFAVLVYSNENDKSIDFAMAYQDCLRRSQSSIDRRAVLVFRHALVFG